jgi:D-glycero-D-manno-heptose 1,7-bisphosphate phosphatase
LKRSALFLDRDGVINTDFSYVHKPEDFIFIDGIFELCSRAQSLDYLLIVVTNQAGIGRGYYSEADFLRLSDWMSSKFQEREIKIDRVYFCADHPEHGLGHYKRESLSRKPAPGMILQAAKDFDIDLRRSILIGDKLSDIQAGIAGQVGCNLLFKPESDHSEHPAPANAVIRQLSEALPYLLAIASDCPDQTS